MNSEEKKHEELMKAYSTDLRQKIIETYEKGHISQCQLAQRFPVAKSFVIKLLKQYRETGDRGNWMRSR